MFNVGSKKKKREPARYTWGLRRNLRQILLVLCTDNGELHTIISQTLWRRNENEWMLYCRCSAVPSTEICMFMFNPVVFYLYCTVLYIFMTCVGCKKNFATYLRLSGFQWLGNKANLVFFHFLDLLSLAFN